MLVTSSIFDDLAMAFIADSDSPQTFADAFTEALKSFLEHRGLGQSEAARQLGIESTSGKRKGGARISSYCRGRAKPDAEILYLLCTKLGFSFEYAGYRITSETLNGDGKRPIGPKENTDRQLEFNFERQFNLTRRHGVVAVKIHRRVGRLDVSLSLDGRAA